GIPLPKRSQCFGTIWDHSDANPDAIEPSPEPSEGAKGGIMGISHGLHGLPLKAVSCWLLMEPPVGVEPTTLSLRMRCSTTELRRHTDRLKKRVAPGGASRIFQHSVLHPCNFPPTSS